MACLSCFSVSGESSVNLQHPLFWPMRPFRLTAPPPPPPPRPPVQRLGGAEAPAEEVRRANAEAQTVLRGLLNAKVGLKSADVPKNLYQHLVESQVALDANTFTLLVEGSAGAGDLQTASDFLMKMEAAGHCASSELLDLVMDLYADGGSRPAGATSAEAIDGRE
mmetsp:Transcript_103872/g.289387  ORF Transcript_103872/g.289387 Transcript_103872/m.289387 type:complete len:165 (-) Transcript_103872:181-675(-)